MEKKENKQQMKKITAFLLCIGIMIEAIMLNTNNVYAITVGGSSVGDYSNGGCNYGNINSSTLAVDEFLKQIKNYGGSSITVKFNYKNNHAWEQDFKPGNWNNDSIDDVNLAIYAGHGLKKGSSGNTILHNSLHFYTLNSYTQYHTKESDNAANLYTTEALWGKPGTSTRWVIALTCNFLNETDPAYANMMQGINIMMGYSDVMYMNRNLGVALGQDYALGANLMDAFLNDAAKHHVASFDTAARVIYAEDARNDTLYKYAYASKKPSPIGGNTTYYQYTKIIPGK